MIARSVPRGKFGTMTWDVGRARRIAVMHKEVVAAFYSNHDEPGFLKGTDDIARIDGRETAHAAVGSGTEIVRRKV